MDEHALARFHLGGAMQHLVGGDVVQHQADRLAGVEPKGHGNECPRREADELGVGAVDGQRGDELA